MTIKQITSRIEHINQVSCDPEKAHLEEDALMRDFIAYVATEQVFAKHTPAAPEVDGTPSAHP